MKLKRILVLSVTIVGLLVGLIHAQTVWRSSNATVTFTKANYADWTQAANQDRITDRIWITRADNQAIFNIKSESSYSQTSPAGSEWAVGTTANYSSLTYDTWYNTVQSVGGPQKSVGKNMVVHLIADNIYIDIKFLSYTGSNGGGGFSYVRAAQPESSLPVQATDFIARADAGSVTLAWKTQSEVDNAGFIVMKRQLDVSNWQLVGSYTTYKSLAGLGTSSSGRDYSFTDNHVVSGSTYEYKIQSVSTSGVVKDLSTLTVSVDVPKSYALYQNYPNPFNPSTTIRFDLKEQSNVTMGIYNSAGQLVLENNYGTMSAGRYNELINMSGFASGVYFYRITADGKDGQKFISIRKMVFMK